jgi:inorganic pyrophosphatase/exopolyphosphatase
LNLGLPLAGIALLIFRNKLRNKDKDLALQRKKTSGKNALKSLKKLTKEKDKISESELYDAIAKVIFKYFAEREQINYADLNRDKLSEVLNSKNINEELTQRAVSLLDECEFARFSPKASVQYSSEILQKTETLIKDLEK